MLIPRLTLDLISCTILWIAAGFSFYNGMVEADGGDALSAALDTIIFFIWIVASGVYIRDFEWIDL